MEIEFILVSTEEAFFDSTIEATRSDRGFGVGGLDCTPDRLGEVRFGFAHFYGEAPPARMSSVPFADRRRVVILNGVAGAPGLEFLEVLHNDTAQSSGALSVGDVAAIQVAINRVEPAVSRTDTDGDGDPDESDPDDDNDGLRDEDEVRLGLDPLIEDSDGNGVADGEEDPDGDGFTNEEELNVLLTDPGDSGSRFRLNVAVAGGELTVDFVTHAGRRYVVERSADAVLFEPVETVEGDGATASLRVGSTRDGTAFYRVRIELLD